MIALAADGGVWLIDMRWGAALLSVIAAVAIWLYLRRRYAVDGRLILREMMGRRGRVASTLLGLSVGIAGLSMVSLTTGAASHLLEFQLSDTIEGNLLIGDPTSTHGEDVARILRSADGVESFSQVTMYQAVLTSINGKEVVLPHRQRQDGEGDLRENSNQDVRDTGFPIGITARTSLEGLPDYQMRSGRALQPGDEGQHLVMLRESFATEEMGIKTGDLLMFLFENDPGQDDDVLIQTRVVGIVSLTSEQTGLESWGTCRCCHRGS